MKRRLPALTEDVARIMGCHLVTENMSRRHQISMESYDRLFPSQDTTPYGGFGNLIGLRFPSDGKEEVRVYNHVDGAVPMLAKMHEMRMKGFKAMGYEQREL